MNKLMKNKILHTIYKTFPALIILVFPVAGIKDVKKSIVFKVIVLLKIHVFCNWKFEIPDIHIKFEINVGALLCEYLNKTHS